MALTTLDKAKICAASSSYKQLDIVDRRKLESSLLDVVEMILFCLPHPIDTPQSIHRMMVELISEGGAGSYKTLFIRSIISQETPYGKALKKAFDDFCYKVVRCANGSLDAGVPLEELADLSMQIAHTNFYFGASSDGLAIALFSYSSDSLGVPIISLGKDIEGARRFAEFLLLEIPAPVMK